MMELMKMKEKRISRGSDIGGGLFIIKNCYWRVIYIRFGEEDNEQ